MKKLLLTLLLFSVVSFSSYTTADDYVQTTMDDNRYEMVQVVFSAYTYNIKFDKWTGNIWLYTKDGVTVAMRDPADESCTQNKQSVYQLMKGNRDSIEHCYVLNTVTGEVWEVTFTKGRTIKFEKK